MSLPEVLLWQRLKGSPQGVSFRKQHPLLGYRADFYCAAASLVIEIDGIAHDMGDRPARDDARTHALQQKGYRVLRIPATDVLRDPDAVASAIVAYARSSPLTGRRTAAAGGGGGGGRQAPPSTAEAPASAPLHHASGTVPLPTSGEDRIA